MKSEIRDGTKIDWDAPIEMDDSHGLRPDVLECSSNKHQNWELFDPEKWVPDGYICVRVDSRGAGRSPGFLETWSPRESKDIAACVDWAGVQPWSNGKVALHGISY